MSQRSKIVRHQRPGQAKRNAELPPGKHAQSAPRLIGLAILGLAAVLIAIGTVMT